MHHPRSPAHLHHGFSDSLPVLHRSRRQGEHYGQEGVLLLAGRAAVEAYGRHPGRPQEGRQRDKPDNRGVARARQDAPRARSRRDEGACQKVEVRLSPHSPGAGYPRVSGILRLGHEACGARREIRAVR